MEKTSIGRASAIVITMLACSAVARAQQPATKAPVLNDAITGVQGFNIVLVLGDLEGVPPDGNGNVPAPARKALADMKDFLPYKSYRLLDTAWILGASQSTSATSRLRGPDDRDYELTLGAANERLSASASGNRTLRITFQLRDPGALDLPLPGRETSSTPSIDHMLAEMRLDGARRAQRWDLEARLAITQAELAKMKEKLSERHPDLLRKRADLDRLVAELGAAQTRSRDAPDFSRRIIDAGFTMDVGETVVVGTSRVRGEKAIVALLTAVPRGTKK